MRRMKARDDKSWSWSCLTRIFMDSMMPDFFNILYTTNANASQKKFPLIHGLSRHFVLFLIFYSTVSSFHLPFRPVELVKWKRIYIHSNSMVDQMIPPRRFSPRRQPMLSALFQLYPFRHLWYMDGDEHVGGCNRSCRAFWFLTVLR